MDMDLDLFDNDEELPKNKKTLTFLERQVDHTNTTTGELKNLAAAQLEVGAILGQGAFATVRVVKSLRNDDGDDNSDDNSNSDSDSDSDDNDANDDQVQPPLVVKMLRPDLLDTKN